MTMTTETNIDKRRAEVARIVGEDKSITMTQPKWLEMMEKGVIVEVHIRRWRARAKLDFGDLGIPREAEDTMYEHLMKLGEKRLLPQKELNGKKVSYVDLLDNIDAQARHWLESKSFDTHWGRFVPYTTYKEWKEGNDAVKKEYFALRDEISDRYDWIVEQLKFEYEAMARAAYRRNTALKVSEVSESKFVDRFLGRVLALVPSRESIYASFGYEEEIRYIPLPSQLAEDVTKAERTKTRATLEEEADRAKISDLRRMNQDVIEQARARKQELIDGFLGDVSRQIRALVYDVTTNVLESINKNGKLVGKTSGQLSNLINTVKGLNFYGDNEVEAMISRVQAIVGTAPENRQVNDITSQLRDIGTLTRASLIALGETPRSGRTVGIPAVPANGVLRQARQSLGLDIEVKPELTGRKSR